MKVRGQAQACPFFFVDRGKDVRANAIFKSKFIKIERQHQITRTPHRLTYI
jgi:hypothetical protein